MSPTHKPGEYPPVREPTKPSIMSTEYGTEFKMRERELGFYWVKQYKNSKPEIGKLDEGEFFYFADHLGDDAGNLYWIGEKLEPPNDVRD